MGSQAYHDLYTWRYPVTENVVGHHDGSISLMVKWSGFELSMLEYHERDALLSAFYQSLSKVVPGLKIEHHSFRYYDSQRAQAYIDYADGAVRQKKLAIKTRFDVATVLSDYSMKNDLVTVFTLPKVGRKRNSAEFKKQEKAATDIFNLIRPFTDRMPGARVLTVDEYGAYVQRANSPDDVRKGLVRGFDHRFHLNEQWCSPKPEYIDGFLKQGNTYIWIGLLDLYPDQANPGWVEFALDGYGCEFQITQLIGSANTRELVAKAEKDQQSEEQGLGQRGGTFLRGKVKDIAAFKNYVADNNIPILNNTYVIRLQHDDLNQLMTQREALNDLLGAQGARAQDSERIQRFFWRVTQPGQGYLTKFERPDAADLVLNMSPFNQHALGSKTPLSLRITEQQQLVYFDLPSGAANHSFIAGKTRSGKGVEKVLRILEAYPMGIDHYMIEYGGSYRWVIEALGGTYIRIDPDKVSVNPLPTYAEYDSAVVDQNIAQLSSFTINSMALILTGGAADFSSVDGGNHHVSRALNVFEALYDEDAREDGDVAPTLGGYLEILELIVDNLDDKSDQDFISFKFLRENLRSFLDSPTGEKFNASEDGLNLTGDCIGIDIKPLVDSGDVQLLSIYLNSIIMRLTNKVISNRDRAELAIDEYHVPAELAPELIKSITSRAVKTWAKENSHVDIISQSPEHFKVSHDVLDQINHRQFMYMESGHVEAAKNFSIPEKASRIWSSWRDPGLDGLPYRHAIRQFGKDTYHIHSRVPKWILQLAETSAKALDIKDYIDDYHPELKGNIWKKLELFESYTNKLNQFESSTKVYQYLVSQHTTPEVSA